MELGQEYLVVSCVPCAIDRKLIIITCIKLRIPDGYDDAKIAKICNLWTLWPVIQLINHLFKIRQKTFCPMFHA